MSAPGDGIDQRSAERRPDITKNADRCQERLQVVLTKGLSPSLTGWMEFDGPFSHSIIVLLSLKKSKGGGAPLLHDELHVYGSWWLPGDPSRKVAGNLDFTVETFGLTVNDALTDAPPATPGPVDFLHQTLPLVHGTSLDGKQRFTLINASGTTFSAPLPVAEQTWTPEAVLIGEHLAVEQPRFQRAWISLDHLADWVKALGIGRDFETDPTSGLLQRITVEARREVLLEARAEGATIRAVTWPKGRAGDRSAEVEVVTQLQIEVDDPISWPALMNDWATPLRDLVALGTCQPTRVLEVDLEIPSDEDEARRTNCELRFRPLAAREPARCHWFEMPMRASELPGTFLDAIRRWFELRQEHVEAITQLSGVIHSPFDYLENRFVALVRAADAYHAVQYGSAPSADSEHDARLQRVRDATADLSDDDRDWLEGLLESSDAPVARHRLQTLLSELSEVGAAVSAGDDEGYAHAIIQTRNRITHPHSRAGARVLTSSESRFWYSEGLLWLIRGHLLAALGVDRGEVHDRLTRSPRYTFLGDRMSALTGT